MLLISQDQNDTDIIKRSKIKATIMNTANALSNVNGKWIVDETNGELKQDGTVLTLKSNSPGTPFNARYDCITPPPDGQDWYFQIQLDSIPKNSSVSVGVVNPEEMLPGWKTRGMFYNGNLTNGAAALVTAFGPYLKQGDSVGVLVTDKNQKVTFYINEKCLGTGFSLGQGDGGKVFCPCIHVSGEATVSFVIPDTLPSVVTREKTTQGMSDEWKLIQAVNETGAAVTVPEARDVILHLEDTEAQYDLSIRVGNTLRCRAKKEEGGGVKVGPAMSTRMEPPPELREMETFVLTSLPIVTSIDLLDQNLVLSASGSHTKLVFERYVKTIKPLETYTNN